MRCPPSLCSRRKWSLNEWTHKHPYQPPKKPLNLLLNIGSLQKQDFGARGGSWFSTPQFKISLSPKWKLRFKHIFVDLLTLLVQGYWMLLECWGGWANSACTFLINKKHIEKTFFWLSKSFQWIRKSHWFFSWSIDIWKKCRLNLLHPPTSLGLKQKKA